ncbi:MULTISPECIES: AlbA family DNA-binding domain-containing protein [unclassified Arthrobacter]|uniref:AlbA family DNA-binding domain-containing protein n=1 Tax=unclassified Arthrobacter TaxID=235627 RepID=UPI002E0C7B6E|nr:MULTISPECIES: ATP-binding protein [unclassified Arthrobacter]MEC5193097.1 hypothetical protein [Arthrobacter sp. MP_M4]MEC5204875.1 hypothetical protein [Arthrobacter sp. MP_M7]
MSATEPEYSGPMPPFAYDGQVGEEKLGELLAVGAEHSYLDFKTELDLKDPTKKLDFIKDCAAMMNLPRGGYLVIGAHDDGTPAKGFEAPTKEMFDSAALTEMVKGYVDAPIDIRAQVHTLRLKGVYASMAVIYVAPPADGMPAVTSKAGTAQSQGGGRIHRFDRGVIFTREGSSNVPVSHRTWGNVLANFRQQQRAESRQDVDALIRRTLQMMGSGAAPPRVLPLLNMDSITFSEAVVSNLRDGSTNVLRRFLITGKNAYLNSASDVGRKTALNKITAVAVEALLLSDIAAVEYAMDALFVLYESHLVDPTRTGGKPGAQPMWLDIILHTMVIGAAAVRGGMYEAIPTIALRRVGDEKYSYRSWIRHGLTEAARAGLFVRAGESSKGGNLIALSSELMVENPTFWPDIQGFSASDPTAAFVDSLCQFDFLWCCLSVANVGEGPLSASFYPSCSAYHQSRILPLFRRLEAEPKIRNAVFGDIPEPQIANAIITVIEMAYRQSWDYGGWWDSPSDLPTNGWTKKTATPIDT